MGRDDVAKALEAMTGDMDVAERMVKGDFTDLPEAEFTEAERAMVSAAADDIPDVGGFAIFVKVPSVPGESKAVFPKVEILRGSPLGIATQYAFPKLEFRK